MPDGRDDFSKSVKLNLARRASFICSNPDCRVHTLAPSAEDEEKFLYIGKAAHITAASEGGPRFDPELTPDQRQSISNGIFLCSNCADMIDKNQGRDYPVDLLLHWKAEHEAWVAKNLNKSAADSPETSTTINVVSHHQRGGITAGVVNLGAPRRRLNDRFKASLLKVLKDKNKEVSVTCTLGDGEALNFATEIVDFLSAQGFQVKGVNQAVWSKPLIGQTIDPDTYGIRIGLHE